MVSFESDYTTIAHPKILERMLAENTVPRAGYGCDEICESAKEKIRVSCGAPDADIFFLVGGTQTNATVISTMLRDFEGVVAADTGHISVHEAGAIEFAGVKVLTVKTATAGLGENTETANLGKITPDTLEKYLQNFYADGNHEHTVFPGMVYISHPTEYGTLYTKAELTALSAICREYKIPLYLDGARLGYGLMSRETDVTLADIAKFTDVFYIGGTKVGAAFGEAVVFPHGNMPDHFLTSVKKRGALLAKGWLLGLQFDTLFTDNLYFEISRHAIVMAEELKKIADEKGCRFYLKSPTNQQFLIFENEKLKRLQEHIAVSFWEQYDENHTVVRLATSFATTNGDLDELKKWL